MLQFDSFVRAGTVLKNYATVLELLLRLRQACAHPFLVLKSIQKNQKQVCEIDTDTDNNNFKVDVSRPSYWPSI